jgi:hypothetical protein
VATAVARASSVEVDVLKVVRITQPFLTLSPSAIMYALIFLLAFNAVRTKTSNYCDVQLPVIFVPASYAYLH